MRAFFKRSTPVRDAALAILFFGLLVPTQPAVGSECNAECNENGCSQGSTVTGQASCMERVDKECEIKGWMMVAGFLVPRIVCTTTTTCETITGACGDFGPLEM